MSGTNELRDQGGARAALSSGRTVAIMIALLFCAMSQGFSMFKLLPLQSAIMEYFSVETGAYGFLNTSQSWLMIVCAVPMGFLVRRLPSKLSISIGFCLIFLGTAVEILSGHFVLFVIGRMIEGAGYSVLSLAYNGLMINMVKPKHAGIAASSMIVMAMIAQIIQNLVGTWMMTELNMPFQRVMLVVVSIQVLCLIAALCIIPMSVKVTGRASDAKPTREQTLRIYKNPSVWFASLGNLCFTLAMVSFNSYIIRYLVTRGMEQGKAATTFSYTTFISIFSMLVFGWLSGKLGTKRKILIFSFFSGIVVMILLATLPVEYIFIYVVLYGTLPRSIAGLGSASSRDLAELPADVPIVNSFRETIAHIGTVVGGIATGYLLQYAGYTVTIYVMAGLMAVGGILWCLVKKVP